MRDLTITAIIKVYQYDELNEADRALVTTAKEATARSYVPYSHFSVGAAALLGDGTVVSGTNQENAAYPSGLCAERTTLFYANSRYPDQPVITLAIAARTEKDFIDNPIPPCGACRQVILETEKRYKQPIRILLYGKECIYEVYHFCIFMSCRYNNSFLWDAFSTQYCDKSMPCCMCMQ